MDRYKFGEFIYQKRKALGLTQEEFGKKLGVTNKAVSKWEVGETLPDIMILEPMAKLFEISVDELLAQKEQSVINKKKQTINKLLLVFVIVLSVLEILTLICSLSGMIIINHYHNKRYQSLLNSREEIIVNEENVNDIVNIYPMTSFTNEGQKITINSFLELKEPLYLENEDVLNIQIVYRINYYYYIDNDTSKIGLITYIRENSFDFTKDHDEYFYNIELVPKNELNNFLSLNKVEVEYQVVYVEGKVYK